MLICLGDGRHVFVGDTVYEFSLDSDPGPTIDKVGSSLDSGPSPTIDKVGSSLDSGPKPGPNHIIEFISRMGNNDVPYPYAKDSAGNWYLLIEDAIIRDVPSDSCDVYGYPTDVYDHYYSMIEMKGYRGIKHAYHNNEHMILNFSAWQKPLKNVSIEYESGERVELSEEDYVKLMDDFAADKGIKKLENNLICGRQ
jgi:hypothetical protein